MSSPVAEGEGRRLAVRLSLLFAAVCTVTGTLLPYLPVWLDWVRLTPREIAVITAMPLLVRVTVSPAIAFAADRSGDHRGFIVVLAWSALAAAVALAHTASFWPILALTLAFSVAAGTVMPLAETVAMTGVRQSGLDYGRMRLWGSLTFIAASAYGGLALDQFGPPATLWLLAGGALCTALAAHALPRAGAGSRPQEAARPRLSLADALGLVRSRTFAAFLVAAGAVQAAHATFYTFGTLHWVAQGLSSGWAGVLWGIGVGVEIGLMAFSGALVRHVGAVELVVLGAAASVARWLAMGFDPPLAALVLLQALHGLTYGATHIGAFYFMTQAVPAQRAGTAQAVYAAMAAGIAMGGAMLLSGQLYAAYGGRTYWAMAAIAAVGFVASLLLRRCRAIRV